MTLGIRDMNEILRLWPLFAFAAIFVGLIYVLSRWSTRDAIRRGKSPIWVTLLVFLFFPLGCLIWLHIRPEISDPLDTPLHPVEKIE